MNKLFLLTTLFTIIFANNTFASDKIIGVWATPSIKEPDFIWYFYPNGKVSTAKNNTMKWELKENKFFSIHTESHRHKFTGDLKNNVIVGKRYARHRDGRKWSPWRAEKYSDAHNKKVDFYRLCKNGKANVWKVVNIGRHKHCDSGVSDNKSTSFSYEKVKSFCIDYSKKYIARYPKIEFKCE